MKRRMLTSEVFSYHELMISGHFCPVIPLPNFGIFSGNSPLQRGHHHKDTKTASWRTTHSLPARFEPFTPDLRPTVWISTSIIVDGTNKCAPILSVRRLPIVTPRRTKYVISVSE